MRPCPIAIFKSLLQSCDSDRQPVGSTREVAEASRTKQGGPPMPTLHEKAMLGAAALVLGSLAVVPALAQTCTGPMRKINVGVAVAPPNVVHTAPYIAKALGFFSKRCIDANIIQFDGGAAGTSVTAVGQGSAISNLPDTAIAQGLKAKQIWGLAPRPPQAYVVSADIKKPADLKGKRLSAAGGIGGFNWLVGRAALREGGLSVDDAQFISQGTAGRLPGFVAGQIDAVALHPEDLHIVQQKKPGAHVLAMVSDLWPKYSFNAYGAADSMIAKDHDLLRDTIAAMIEANRAIYRDREKVIPIIMEATQKPRDAVEFSIDMLTKNCILSINSGFVRERTEWTHQNNIDIGDIPPEKKLAFDQIADHKLADEAVASLGGPVTINSCKD
jgi:NitT/TauT family transport system substrate-binding protein